MGKFLVTGGCGFIGSHLVEYLSNHSRDIVVIDDLSTGFRSNLQHLETECQIVIDKVENLNIYDYGPIDAIFHLAAQASVPLSIENFRTSTSTNILSTINVIEYCARTSTPLIYASSSAVYGNLPKGSEGEGVDLLSPYAVDKFVSEIYCAMANRLYGLKSFGLRFFNVYGPRQDPKNPYSGVISIFIDRMIKNECLVINGGNQTRDFIYVSDVIKGLWGAYRYLQKNNCAVISNMLTGRSTSIDELVESLIKINGSVVQYIRKELPFGDPLKSEGTVIKMNELLDLFEFVTLDEGLKTTFEWIKKNYEQN